MQEVPVNLSVQVIAIGHDDKREVARLLAENLANVENHREALARPLRVPEHAELALQGFAIEKRFVGAVHADELMILGDDFLVVLIIKNEILHIIQQPLLGEQARDYALPC